MPDPQTTPGAPTAPRETPHYTTPDGHRWPFRITVTNARRIRETLGVDLLAVTAPPADNPFTKLANDLYLLADVLWSLQHDLAESRGIDHDTFIDQTWAVLDSATEALLAGVIDSFPEAKRRGLKALAAAQQNALGKVLERLTPRLDALVDAAVEDAVAHIRPPTRTNSPGS